MYGYGANKNNLLDTQFNRGFREVLYEIFVKQFRIFFFSMAQWLSPMHEPGRMHQNINTGQVTVPIDFLTKIAVKRVLQAVGTFIRR